MLFSPDRLRASTRPNRLPMKRAIYTLLFLLPCLGYGQNFAPGYQSNPSLSFSTFLGGVRYAYVALTEEISQQVNTRPDSEEGQAVLAILDYLKEKGFENVQWGSMTNIPSHYASICELVIVKPTWKKEPHAYTNITVTYESCRGDVFRFESDKDIQVNVTTDIQATFHKRLLYMYGYKKSKYFSANRLTLDSEITEWNEEKIKDHLKDVIE